MKCCGSVRKDLLARVMKKPATSSLPRYVPLMVLLPGTIHSMSSAMSFMAPSRSPAPKAWYAACVAALFSAADMGTLLHCPDPLTEAERRSARQGLTHDIDSAAGTTAATTRLGKKRDDTPVPVYL